VRRPRSNVLGLDLSLTGAGIVVVPSFWNLNWQRITVAQAGYKLKQSSTEHERFARIDAIEAVVMGVAAIHGCRVAVIEQHAFSKSGGHALERAELVGVVKRSLFKAGVEVFAYNATTARTLLGKAPRKDPKVWAHQRLYAMGAPRGWTGDQLDAFLQVNQHLSLVGGTALMMAR
jgi:Holliday junction resolvasome RuvABC endonuclease subunit